MKSYFKSYLFIAQLLIVTLFFASCAGGKPVKKMPQHIKIGHQELKKGGFWYKKGCYNKALKHFFRAHEKYVATDQLEGVAMCLNNIGNIYRFTDDTDSALLFYEESYNIYEAVNNHQLAIQALSNKSALLIDRGRLKEAANELDRGERIAQGKNLTFAPMLKNRGIFYIKEKKFKEAGKFLDRALAETDPENFSEIAAVNFSLGNLMVENKEYEKAALFFEKALNADKKTGLYNSIAGDLAAIAKANLLLGRNEIAANFFKRSVKIYAFLGDKEKALNLLAQMEDTAGKSGVDTTITKHFVESWLKGETLTGPCE
jgi:tetratricopeptide (TPR) repeat protein